MGSQTPRGIVCKAQPIHVSSVLPTEGFRVRCAVNAVMTSVLIDTGAVVTLLRKDTWDSVSAGYSRAATVARPEAGGRRWFAATISWDGEGFPHPRGKGNTHGRCGGESSHCRWNNRAGLPSKATRHHRSRRQASKVRRMPSHLADV